MFVPPPEPHRPDDESGTVLGQDLRHLVHLGFGHAGHVLHRLRPVLGHHLFADLVHAVDAAADVFLVLPAVLEHVIEQAEEERHVAARANAHVLVGFRRGAGKARIGHDHLAAVLLGVQRVQHRHRVRLGRVRAEEQQALRVLLVVVRVGHRAVAPGIGDAGDGGRMADARLVVGVVGAEQAHELAQQVGLLVVVLGGPDPESRVGPAFFSDLKKFL